MAWQFVDDPVTFLDLAGEVLAADPLIGTVPAATASREVAAIATGARPDSELPHWFACWRDEHKRVAGVAMRTAPFAPYPAYLLPLPRGAAAALARTLHERGEEVGGVNGSLAECEEFAAQLGELTGSQREVEHHSRLFGIQTLIEPPPVPGSMRVATEDDLDLAHAWFEAFMGDADEQAGRPRGSSAHATRREDVRRRLPETFLWQDEAGEVVNLTSTGPPSFGVVRLGPVYTPSSQRARGYASANVAGVTRRMLAKGLRPCLFTDQANPTSNAIYQALGYEPVVDMISLRLPPGPAGHGGPGRRTDS